MFGSLIYLLLWHLPCWLCVKVDPVRGRGTTRANPWGWVGHMAKYLELGQDTLGPKVTRRQKSPFWSNFPPCQSNDNWLERFPRILQTPPNCKNFALITWSCKDVAQGHRVAETTAQEVNTMQCNKSKSCEILFGDQCQGIYMGLWLPPEGMEMFRGGIDGAAPKKGFSTGTWQKYQMRG